MRCKYFVLVCLVAGFALLWQCGCREQTTIETGPATGAKEVKEPEKVDVGRDSGPQPKITFAKLGHDFGKVAPNKLNIADIKFTNTGDGVLKITKLSECCGVVAKLDKDKTEYAPGESGAVKVEWRSLPQPMTFSRELILHSNDKASPATKLTIQAKIELNVTWEPERLRLFLDEDNAGCPKVTVSSIDNRPFSITAFKSTGDCITADFDPSVEATKFVLEPKVNTDKLDKNLKGTVSIGLTHPDGNAAVFRFDVLPKYTINPPLLIIFDAEPDKPLVRIISVLNNYNKDFEVQSMSSKGETVGIKVLEQKKIRNGYQLEVEIMPPPSEGKARFMGEFYLGIKGGEKLPIRCNGYYKKTRPVSTTQ